MKNRPGCEDHNRCFYCGCVLSPNHEHDHFPLPRRHDGSATVPSCINCHDLKDRIPLHRWPPAKFLEELHAIETALDKTTGRLLLAKLVAAVFDLQKQADDKKV